MPFFHRLRPPDGIHKTDTFSVHLWEPELNHESDSGDETRQDLKIPTVSDGSLPRALSCSCLSVYRCHFRCYGRVCLIPRLTLSSG
ncbi:hypothetical protein PANT111_410001 [Pantoea brenneri]|uniref:Uncharacterized protein n=1 Tax=Pantoea brenneri TaxID=472694 RepID=A0AAX3JB67_9GAMM|nr:hypothetical protein PANT111_410001 [Pantoea brenneri]